MEFKDLVGQQILNGFDRETITVRGEDAEVCYLDLGGTVYRVSEDPDDGYRSSADGPKIVTDHVMVNRFRYSVMVTAEHRDKDRWGASDVLVLRSQRTNEVVLEIGTDNIDDYYPSYVCNWSPEYL